MMGKQDFRCDCRHEELWHFVGGKVKAEDVVSQILATRNTYSLPLGEFLRTLSILDPQTHRLRPTLPAADTPAYTPGHVTLVAWKSEPTARILCVSGLSGSGTTVFASRVLGELLEHHGTQDSPVLSFAFSRSNPRARSPFGLCLSLCRQLVSFQPQLFRHVSSVASFWMGSGCFTTECLWILFRSMVMSLVGKGASVYCVICSLDDCVTSPDEAVHRMEELAIAGDGRFKLVFTHTDSMQNALGSETGQRYCIALDNSSQIMEAWKKQHIQSRIQDIVQGNASWDGLTDLALAQAEKLPSDSPYLLIKANMILLEWITKGWTRKQLKERLQQPPSSLQECYDEVIRTIKNDCRTWVLIALQWIACAARPMRPAELAVAVALSQIPGQARRYRDRDSKYMYEIHDMIRRDILADLRDCMAPFIQVENNRVSFIHVTFRDFLLTNKPSLYYSESGESENDGNDGNDEDYHILNLSLEYLRQIEQSPSRSINDSDSQYFLPADHEYALLAYATLHWPDHFLKTASREAAQEHVLQFLKDSKRVSSWAAWYEQLNPSLRRSPISINSPLQIVSRFGLSCLVDVSITLLEEKIQLEEREDEKSKCLDLAAEHGHHDVVKTLLNMGIRSKDALGLAAEQGAGTRQFTMLPVAGTNMWCPYS
ncbi:hypothetical protein F5B18DRAFT_441376 [Nemania serpens]|nr:hypothetical protein F5B18DRAFT_441376 [Nemania serpens]